ncbi:MAG TPA: IclR family transcriptional regulator [Thermoleophilia bacterium]|nr:IclR family transcriptional regulator [Thermoleophilia bacterium]
MQKGDVVVEPAQGMAELDQSRRDGVQVIARAAEMLRTLAADPDGLQLMELAAKVDLPRSTTHRIVRALSKEGFVRAAPSGRLSIGPGLVGIATSGRRDRLHEAGPYLEELSYQLQETVDLAVLDAGHMLFVDQYAPSRFLRIVAEIGARFPLYCTANGKAILAGLPEDEVESLLPDKLEPFTPNTITDRSLLLRELERVRETGLAYDREEHTAGVIAVGAAIRDSLGTPAAVTVVIPAVRFIDVEERVEQALLRTCEEIQAVLGGG